MKNPCVWSCLLRVVRQFPAPLGVARGRAAPRHHSVERWPPRAKDRVTLGTRALPRVCHRHSCSTSKQIVFHRVTVCIVSLCRSNPIRLHLFCICASASVDSELTQRACFGLPFKPARAPASEHRSLWQRSAFDYSLYGVIEGSSRREHASVCGGLLANTADTEATHQPEKRLLWPLQAKTRDRGYGAVSRSRRVATLGAS